MVSIRCTANVWLDLCYDKIQIMDDHILPIKIKDLALIFVITVFSPSRLHLLSKSISSKHFAT